MPLPSEKQIAPSQKPPSRAVANEDTRAGKAIAPPEATQLPLSYEQLARSQPLVFLQGPCKGEWENARHMYKKGEISEETMLSLVTFRDEVIGEDSELVKSTIESTFAYVAEKRKTLKAQNPGLDFPEPQRVKFSAPGSKSPTSDIDYNLKGDGTEFAVREFNRLARMKFGYEPGTFFDVNAYSKDFLPDFFSGGGYKGTKEEAAEENESFFQTNKLPAGKIPVPDPKMANVVRAKGGDEEMRNKGFGTKEKAGKGIKETELTPAYEKDDFQNQETFSYVKMQMYLTASQWKEYKEGTLKDLDSDSRKELSARFADAEKAYLSYLAGLSTKLFPEVDSDINKIKKKANEKDGLEKLKGKIDSATEISKMEAHNAIYEEQLAKIELLRDKIMVAKARLKGATGEEATDLKQMIDVNMLFLKDMVNQSLMFANEAYLTEGAITHVVGDQQIKANIVKDLNPEQLMHAFNENMGDSFKELARHQGEGLGAAAIKTGKYLKRATIEAKAVRQKLDSLGQDTSMFKEPNLKKMLKELNTLGKELEGIKNTKTGDTAGSGASSDPQTKALALLNKLGISTHEGLLEQLKVFLLSISRAFNSYRFAKAGKGASK